MGSKTGLSTAAGQGDESRHSQLPLDFTHLLAVVTQMRYIKKQTKVHP
jgi:hypothetical protein